ncbi:NADH:flavin oxidoreductase [Solihabitans fulvus]|uniref:NADH:flavin oxidoreductase n=1 Tax=Solihabitans fulvus TaxID=1892852 RepID=A0A5B2WUY7_9PSEU|nr:NADH:flavin oxidoreductase [Solihabitans fulvus]KAA2254279.1 NADH:flavin oxidoreductase [Solihabitans fulvus]
MTLTAATHQTEVQAQVHPVLSAVRIGPLSLANRVAVAPMSRVSTSGDGVPTAEMSAYYERFAAGGFGLLITEGTYTDHAFSQAYPNQPAIVTAEQVDSWRAVTDAVHAAGGRIVLQLMHAGALSQHNHHRDSTIGPSSVRPLREKMAPYGGTGPFAVPVAATQGDIDEAVGGFATSAVLAREAGFDGVEVHGANGYLIDQFLTTYTNLRTDSYGGDVHGRVRLATQVLLAIRAEVGPDYPVGIRLSQTKVNDLDYRWPGGHGEAEVIFRAVADAGASYLHLASEGRDWLETATLDSGETVTRLARTVTGLPVIANGGMHDVERAASVLRDGHADLIALARGALTHADWPRRVASGTAVEAFDRTVFGAGVTLTDQAEWEAGRAGDRS